MIAVTIISIPAYWYFRIEITDWRIKDNSIIRDNVYIIKCGSNGLGVIDKIFLPSVLKAAERHDESVCYFIKNGIKYIRKSKYARLVVSGDESVFK